MKLLNPDYSGVVEHAQELATKQNDADVIRGDVVNRVLLLYEFLSRRRYPSRRDEQYYDREGITAMIASEQLSKRELYAVIDKLPETIEQHSDNNHIPLPFVSGLIQASYNNGLNDFDIDLAWIPEKKSVLEPGMYALFGQKGRLLQVTFRAPCLREYMKGSRYLDLRVLGPASNVAECAQNSVLYFPESYDGFMVRYNSGVTAPQINANGAENCMIYVPDATAKQITQEKTKNCTIHVITDEIKKELEK